MIKISSVPIFCKPKLSNFRIFLKYPMNGILESGAKVCVAFSSERGDDVCISPSSVGVPLHSSVSEVKASSALSLCALGLNDVPP